MTVLVIIFAALTLSAGIVMVINPQVIFSYLRNNLDKLVIHIIAVVVRLVLGALLVTQADISRLPLLIEVIGWLTIVAALFLAVMGRNNFRRLMLWALSFFKSYGRVSGFFAVVFGAFLIYAFI